MGDLEFTEVAADQAAKIQRGVSSSWKLAIESGKMISMPQRPVWTAGDKDRTGQRLHTKRHDKDTPADGFYVWLSELDVETDALYEGEGIAFIQGGWDGTES